MDLVITNQTITLMSGVLAVIVLAFGLLYTYGKRKRQEHLHPKPEDLKEAERLFEQKMYSLAAVKAFIALESCLRLNVTLTQEDLQKSAEAKNKKTDYTQDLSKPEIQQIIDLAHAKGKISKSSRNRAHKLRILRNKIIHETNIKLLEEEAEEFIRDARIIINSLGYKIEDEPVPTKQELDETSQLSTQNEVGETEIKDQRQSHTKSALAMAIFLITGLLMFGTFTVYAQELNVSQTAIRQRTKELHDTAGLEITKEERNQAIADLDKLTSNEICQQRQLNIAAYTAFYRNNHNEFTDAYEQLLSNAQLASEKFTKDGYVVKEMDKEIASLEDDIFSFKSSYFSLIEVLDYNLTIACEKNFDKINTIKDANSHLKDMRTSATEMENQALKILSEMQSLKLEKDNKK